MDRNLDFKTFIRDEFANDKVGFEIKNPEILGTAQVIDLSNSRVFLT